MKGIEGGVDQGERGGERMWRSAGRGILKTKESNKIKFK